MLSTSWCVLYRINSREYTEKLVLNEKPIYGLCRTRERTMAIMSGTIPLINHPLKYFIASLSRVLNKSNIYSKKNDTKAMHSWRCGYLKEENECLLVLKCLFFHWNCIQSMFEDFFFPFLCDSLESFVCWSWTFT